MGHLPLVLMFLLCVEETKWIKTMYVKMIIVVTKRFAITLAQQKHVQGRFSEKLQAPPHAMLVGLIETPNVSIEAVEVEEGLQ
jgi:hypothetical protein